MSNYRRYRVAGGTYFFTVKLAQSESTALIDNVGILRTAFQNERATYPFEIIDAVILPNHLHAIWRLPDGDSDYSNRWRRIKCHVTKAVNPKEKPSYSKVKRQERGFWQRRFWEHTIQDADELAHYRAYCWINPVKHGYVSTPIEWAHSSFHRAVRCGDIDGCWNGV